jgi:uncharacterized membrane protein YraQ (UPF0718 family)
MYSAGLRAETTLSAMIASPTLNIVVLTMLFSLLPLYMALIKIALSLLVILVAVPLICRMLPRSQLPPEEIVCPLPLATVAGADPAQSESSVAALVGVLRSYASNLWYIVRMTVPLMLLAGILGAAVATLLPQDQIVGLGFAVGVLVLIALVGLFLPVPIAFDVVVTGALLGAGLAPGSVMTLLFTLGIFSVYSFFIVVQSVGYRAAWMLSVCVVALGILAGVDAQTYHQWQSDRALRLLMGAAPASMFGAAYADGAGVTVNGRPLNPPSPPADTGFVRREASEIGIDKPLEFSFRDMWPPFWEGRSLSSGDIDRDGDLDLVVASTKVGLYVYENDGTGRFTTQPVTLGPLSQVPIFNAVLADIDNDGWLDLFLTTYLHGNYLWRNGPDGFGAHPPERITDVPDAVLTLAVAMADADRDGDLDIALGQWAAGWYRQIPGEESRNRLVWNDGGDLSDARITDLPGLPGETLSILFSDIDSDGMADLLVGNDFAIPDYIYRGDGAGGFDMITRDTGLIEHTTTTTMAIKTADLDNTGHMDLYFAQIAGRSSGVSGTLKMQPLAQYCDAIQKPQAKATCVANMAIKSWYKAGNNFDPTYASRCQQLDAQNKEECRAMLVKDLAIQRRDPKVCALIPTSQPIPRAYCEIHFKPSPVPTSEALTQTQPQILRSNVLLRWNGSAWKDVAEAKGLHVGGWSWDTKIADFDHDGLQDVYIVNGTWVPNEVSPSNLFFHNNGADGFTEASGPFGLEDYLMTAAATTFDIDNDGDLDLVTHPVNGPLVVFINTTQTPGVVFALDDRRGNRDGIGAVLRLTDNTGRTQMREVQLGGGFMSFDAARVHFGLGATQATRLQITWADGTSNIVDGPFEPGQLYTVTRD